MVHVYGEDCLNQPINEWPLIATCDIAECFPDDDAETQFAITLIENDGAYLVGGGAAPIFRLIAVS
jgi:hypothetical protein